MKTTLEDLSSVKKKLTVEVEADDVNKMFAETYARLKSQVSVPGFRKGKAPGSIIEKRYGKQVEQDVEKDLVQDSFYKALDEHNLIPLNIPLLEKGDLKKGNSFSYNITFEVRPKFDLEKYSGVEVEKESADVTDEDVQKRITDIIKSHGQLKDIEEERPVEKGDYALIDYQAFEGDAALEDVKAENFLVNVGEGNFHTGFETSLIGLKKGSDEEFDVKFEDTYFNKNLAGKNVKFKVKLKEIKSLTVSELNDEFIKKFGDQFKTVDDFKAELRKSMENEKERKSKDKMEKNLLSKIADSVDFEIPSCMVDADIENSIKMMRQNLQRSGSDFEKMGLSEDKIRNDFRPNAERKVKEMLVLGEVSIKENITVTDEDLDKHFNDIAVDVGQPVEIVKQYYESQKMTDSLKDFILGQKTLKFLVDNAVVKDVGPQTPEQNAG